MSNTAPRFLTTQWTVVLAAGDEAGSGAREALQWLCQNYWYPVYAHIRRRVNRPEEARDLTQAFFAWLVENQLVERADPDRGRFRTFLLTLVNRFVSNQLERARAIKRGGKAKKLSLDFDWSEQRYLEIADRRLSADAVFHRQWAYTLLARVQQRLRDEHQDEPDRFAVVFQLLTDSGHGQIAGEAHRLGINEGTLRTAVYRLRKRFAAILRAEIRATVASDAEVEDEIRVLFQAFDRQ